MHKAALLTSSLLAMMGCETNRPAKSESPQQGSDVAAEQAAPKESAQPSGKPVSGGDPEPLARASNALAFDLYQTDQLYITDAFHKAFVKVDEKGTEAAAATAVVMGLKGAGKPPEPKNFIADHPFLFIIEDTRTRAILFLGRVVDPR